MKKLVSAAVIAALVAAAANAEVTVKLNGRVRGDLFEMTSGEADTENVIFSNSSNDTDTVVSSGASDTLEFSAKSDYAGVDFAFSNDMSKGTVGFDSWTAWMKFGNLKIQGNRAGKRTANRVTTDQNNVSLLEGNLTAKGRIAAYKTTSNGNDVYEWKTATLPNSGKLGINKNLAGIFGTAGAANSSSDESQLAGAVGADIDNYGANITGSTAMAWGLEYGFAETLPLTIRGYLIESSGESVTTGDDGTNTSVLNSQYAFQIDYNQKDSFRVTADAKIAHKRMAFGVFFSPLMVENLALTVGGTLALDNTNYVYADASYLDNITYWGVDLRGRYAISEAMAVTLHGNISGVSTTLKDTEDLSISALALDFVGNFSYTLNDLAKLFVEAEYASISLDAGNADKNQVYVTATTKSTGAAKGWLANAAFTGQFGAVLTAGKEATVTPAVRLTLTGLGLDKDTGYAQGMLISLPVVMKVQL